MGGMDSPVVAVMAAQQRLSGFAAVVVSQRHIAVWTFQDMTATSAGDEGAVAAPMDEQQPLLAPLWELAQGSLQGAAEEGTVAVF